MVVRGLRPRSAIGPGSGISPREVEGWGEAARAAGSVPVWELRWMRWLTMMLLPKPPMEAVVVLCSRCTTAVMPPSAISRWILLKASSPLAPGSALSPVKDKAEGTWFVGEQKARKETRDLHFLFRAPETSRSECLPEEAWG